MAISVKNFDPKKITFGKVENVSFEGKIDYKRVPVKYIIEDQEKDFVLLTEKHFSWGIQKDSSKFNKNQEGYTLPIVLFEKGKSGELIIDEKQKAFERVLIKIGDVCKKHCVSIKEELERFDLEERDIKKILLSCLYVKKEFKGKKYVPVENYSPTLYAKLLYSKREKRILTKFYKCKDVEDETEIVTRLKNVEDNYERKRMYVKAALKIDYIYVGGNTISLQIRVLDVNCTFIETEEKSYLNRRKVVGEGRSSDDDSSSDDVSEEEVKQDEINNYLRKNRK